MYKTTQTLIPGAFDVSISTGVSLRTERGELVGINVLIMGRIHFITVLTLIHVIQHSAKLPPS